MSHRTITTDALQLFSRPTPPMIDKRGAGVCVGSWRSRRRIRVVGWRDSRLVLRVDCLRLGEIFGCHTFRTPERVASYITILQ
eukprot:6210604-Pleurochrysis_carterae.AAC.1